MMRLLLVALLILVLCVGVGIGFFNAQPVRFNYLAGEVQLPLIALVIGEFLLVATVTGLLAGIRMLAMKAEIRRLRRQIKDAQAELQSLRNLPLKDS